jgi:hypothetical protein
MATPFVYKNAYLSIAGNDLSPYLAECQTDISHEEVDVTVHGDTARHGIPGMQNWYITAVFNQSFTAAEIDSIISPLVGAASPSAIVFKPNGSTTSGNNPKWTGNGRIFEYPVISGAVGTKGSTTVTIKPGDGAGLVRATSD